MARKNKTLTTAFDTENKDEIQQTPGAIDNEQKDVTVNSNIDDVDEVVMANSNIAGVKEVVTVNSNTDDVKGNVTTNSNIDDGKEVEIPEGLPETIVQYDLLPEDSLEQVKIDLLSMYEEKLKKKTVEETHLRSTFLFNKELSKRLDALAKNKRGFKTLFMNKAIETLLNEMEK